MLYELNSVGYHFDKGVPALSNITFSVESGSVVLIIGNTGAGKTTLLRMLYRDLRPTSGTIIFKSQNMAKLSSKKLRLLRQISGIIFQEPALVSKLTCYENIMIPLALNGFPKTDANTKILEIMAQFGINYLRTQLPDKLSVGERKLISIARGLVHNPEIIIGDEITENLDDGAMITIFELLRKANDKGSTVILSSTDATIISRFPRANIITLNEGKIVSYKK